MADRTSQRDAPPAPEGARDIRFRGGGFVVAAWPGAPLAFFAAIIALWEIAIRAGWISPIFLPAPSAIAVALYELAESGLLWKHVSISLVRILAGWTAGTAAGIAVGTAMGVWSLARAVGVPFVSALFPIPKIALLPLLILWLGIGEPSKVATIALGVFFPTVIAVYSGIDAVPRNLIRMAQSFDLPPRAVLWKIILPGALPSILSGFRVTASIALILLVAAEMIGAEFGIGAFILATGNLMRTDQLMAGVTLLSVLGLLIGAGCRGSNGSCCAGGKCDRRAISASDGAVHVDVHAPARYDRERAFERERRSLRCAGGIGCGDFLRGLRLDCTGAPGPKGPSATKLPRPRRRRVAALPAERVPAPRRVHVGPASRSLRDAGCGQRGERPDRRLPKKYPRAPDPQWLSRCPARS